MDDLKIIVYIIAALIWVVARNYKKVQKTRPTIVPKASASPVEVIKPVAVPVEKLPYKKMSRQSLHDSYKSERLNNVVPKTKVGKAKPRTVFDFSQGLKGDESTVSLKVEEESVNEKNSFFEFDLRKAIIYSEILRRPVY